MGIQSSKVFRLAVITILVAIVNWAEPHLRTVKTPSVRYSLLWEVGGTGGKGDYVRVPLPVELQKEGRPPRLTKRIGCVGGELLSFANGGHYCNGEWLGSVLKFGSDGRPLAPFVWNGVIPAGKVFLVGDDPRSFDSRYLGFFDQSQTIRLKGIL